MSAISYYVLSRCLITHEGPQSILGSAVRKDFKGRISVVIYVAQLRFIRQSLGCPRLYAFVALLWLVPDTRIERKLQH
jgi:hypothetical protein